MQRIVCRYRRDTSVSTLSHSDIRALIQGAMVAAGLPMTEGRRAVLLGSPLPPGATSEAERLVLELQTPLDPSEVRHRVNRHLPPGVEIVQAWIAQPGGPEEQPTQLDEAVYHILWRGALDADEVRERLQQFFRAAVVPYTRVREHKTQQLNARALVHDAHLLDNQDGLMHLQATISVGPTGTLRPEEFLQVLGYAPDLLHVHRVAVQQSAWRHPTSPSRTARWRAR